MNGTQLLVKSLREIGEPICTDAADEIDALAAERDALRESTKDWYKHPSAQTTLAIKARLSLELRHIEDIASGTARDDIGIDDDYWSTLCGTVLAIRDERDLILIRAENAERALEQVEAKLAEATQQHADCIDYYEKKLCEVEARLAEAEALLREGCGYIDDVPDRRSAYKDRVRAFLAADSTSEGVYCKWCNVTSRPGETQCPACGQGSASLTHGGEPFPAHRFVPCNPDLDDSGICHECGREPEHPIHADHPTGDEK